MKNSVNPVYSFELYNSIMKNADLSLIRQLSDNSGPYRDPLSAIDWTRLDSASFWLPEPALSLYGLRGLAYPEKV